MTPAPPDGPDRPATPGGYPDDEPDVEPRANVDWGPPSPKVDALLEFWHTRVYNGFNHSRDLRTRLSGDEWDDLSKRRLEADDRLDAADRRTLAVLEDEIRRIERGDGPPDVDDMYELDVAWCALLADTDPSPGDDDADGDADDGNRGPRGGPA